MIAPAARRALAEALGDAVRFDALSYQAVVENNLRVKADLYRLSAGILGPPGAPVSENIHRPGSSSSRPLAACSC